MYATSALGIGYVGCPGKMPLGIGNRAKYLTASKSFDLYLDLT